MKQKDIYKILAIFLGLTMVFSIFAYMFLGPAQDTTQQTNESQSEKYNPEFWVINQPYNSISDALNMTPPGAYIAVYADTDSMTPQMVQIIKQQELPLINQVDLIYKSNTTKLFYTRLKLKDRNNESFLLLSTILPEKNDFEYIQSPNAYPPILIRQERDYRGIYNIMGDPIIFAPPQTAIDTLQIIYSQNRTNTSYDMYQGLLSKVTPVPFQTISSNETFAKQYYKGIKFNNGSYERTTVYLDMNSNTMKNLTRSKANSTQNRFTDYNITKSGNYTIVKILGSDLSSLLNENIS